MVETPIQRFYRRQAKFYDLTRWIMLHGRREAVAKLGLRPESAVLEVGCGTGLNFRHILARLDPERGRLTGLDFSASMLARARRRVVRNGWSGVGLVQGDATVLPFSATFDAVLFAYSLSMVPDFAAALRGARACLRSGGVLVVLDFGPFTGWGPLGPWMRKWMDWHGVQTTRPYEEELRRLFTVVDVHRRWGNYCFVATATREPT